MAFLLLAISILPVLVILIYFNKRDKYEKEPIRVLLRAFSGGLYATALLFILFFILGTRSDSSFTSFTNNTFFSSFLDAFVSAAIPEEASKFIFLYILIWKSIHFNERFDGIIYSVYVSLGFACVENIFYVFNGGIGIGISRALFSIPGHAMFGVIMGYYFAMAKFFSEKKAVNLAKGLGLAVLAHGVFDLILLYSGNIMEKHPFITLSLYVLFLVFFVYLWRYSSSRMNKHIEASCFKNTATQET